MEIRPARMTDLDGIRRCAQAAYAPYVPRIGKAPAPMLADFASLIGDGKVNLQASRAAAVTANQRRSARRSSRMACVSSGRCCQTNTATRTTMAIFHNGRRSGNQPSPNAVSVRADESFLDIAHPQWTARQSGAELPRGTPLGICKHERVSSPDE